MALDDKPENSSYEVGGQIEQAGEQVKDGVREATAEARDDNDR